MEMVTKNNIRIGYWYKSATLLIYFLQLYPAINPFNVFVPVINSVT